MCCPVSLTWKGTYCCPRKDSVLGRDHSRSWRCPRRRQKFSWPVLERDEASQPATAEPKASWRRCDDWRKPMAPDLRQTRVTRVPTGTGLTWGRSGGQDHSFMSRRVSVARTPFFKGIFIPRLKQATYAKRLRVLTYALLAQSAQ